MQLWYFQYVIFINSLIVLNITFFNMLIFIGMLFIKKLTLKLFLNVKIKIEMSIKHSKNVPYMMF